MPKVSVATWVRFSIAALVYSLWVIWLGSWWLLIGVAVIFDIYISKKVPWDFWKRTKDGEKPKAWIEWADALIFALVAVYFINLFLFQNYKIPTSSLEKTLLVGDHLFVSKMSYGPRIPQTPLSFPLLQNTVPILNTKSYSEWPQWEYRRLKGFGEVENDDIVVFNFPTGDTVPTKYVNPDIYILSRNQGMVLANSNMQLMEGLENASQWEINNRFRELGKQQIMLNPEYYGEVVYRPVDRRDNYVKRCIAIGGDSLEIRHNQVYINGIKAENPEGLQHFYNVITDGTTLNARFLDKMEISDEDASRMNMGNGYYMIPLTEKKAEQMKSFSFVRQMSMDEDKIDSTSMPQVWPYSTDYKWSRDNYGPLYIPKRGATVKLSLQNMVIYDRVITAYEGNTLKVTNGDIYINDVKTDEYTFKMNYYFMMGDNRHQSADSRYWGFVPEDHVVGRPILVWLSLNKDKSWFGGKIRFNRFFKWVVNE